MDNLVKQDVQAEVYELVATNPIINTPKNEKTSNHDESLEITAVCSNLNEISISLLDKNKIQHPTDIQEQVYSKSLSKLKTNKQKFEKLDFIKGYLFGVLYALSICMANILVKMAPSLDGSNHSCIRYIIQLTVMSFFIKKNNLDFLGPKKQRKLLLLRGIVGSMAVLFSFFSLRYLDVSDVETITNASIIFTAIIGRIFLNEKLTLCHILALFLTITGVVFVIRPIFLFGIEENLENLLHINLSSHLLVQSNDNLASNQNNETFLNAILPEHKSTEIINHSNRNIAESVMGVVLVSMSAICMSIAQVSIRKLCLGKIHFSVTSIYPAYAGLPASILISAILILTRSSHTNINEEADTLLLQIFYSFCSGSLGTMGIIFLNHALRHEDATKIGMTKTLGVIFSFILQYFLLGIKIDMLGLIGAFFVISSIIGVMSLKLFEKNIKKSKNSFLQFLSIKF